jgi:DNA-binding transcriptional LysR family regulator
MRLVNLDMDVLRTFAVGMELGSFTKAAERLGRSQSAISTQLHKLEEQVGQPLLQKQGRGLVPTNAGENLLSYARRILHLNDEAVSALHGAQIDEEVCLGIPQDFAEMWLPSVLGIFARSHPKVRLDVRVERNSALVEGVSKGKFDVAIIWGGSEQHPQAHHIADVPIVWVADANRSLNELENLDPLPLIAFEAPCVFRSAAVEALDKAGRSWRLVFTSPSLASLWAAAEAGLGIVARSPIGVPQALKILNPTSVRLPVLSSVPLSLLVGSRESSQAVRRLYEIIESTIQTGLLSLKSHANEPRRARAKSRRT